MKRLKPRRAIVLLLVLTLLCGLLPQISLPAASGLIYSGSCGDNLTWTLDESTGKFTVTGSGKMTDWTTPTAPWLHYNTKIKSVVLSEGVTRIGAFSFWGCGMLEDIHFPASLTGIGKGAFECTGLSSVTIPKTVTGIAAGAFADCAKLTRITVEAGNPDYVNDSAGVLYNKDKSQILQCPGAYTGSYSIADTVLSVWPYAFYGCAKLTAVTIPKSTTYVGDRAFDSCGKLSAITVASGNTHYLSDSGFLYSKDKTKLIQAPGAYRGSFTVPATVTVIGYCAFADCKGLTGVSFPAGLTELQQEAFRGCSALVSVSIPSGVKRISVHAFQDCTKLSSLTIANGVTAIDYAAFYRCPKLSWVKIPASVTYIDNLSLGYGATNTHTGGFIIYGYEGTEAEEYANARGFTFRKLDPVSGFWDVSPDAYYYRPMLWALQNKITSGTSAVSFSPKSPCTREQIVTFLWKANGSPNPKSYNNPFTDVKESKYYYKAVLWAVENKIASGTTRTTFGVGKPCTRAQAVTFLWKAKGSPEPRTTDNPFTDVPADKYYYKAVLWAVENKITSGLTRTTFGVNKTCTRGQIVTFLYKAFAVEEVN